MGMGFDEDYYTAQEIFDEDRLKDLCRGFHTMENRKLIPLKSMGKIHLQNSIRYGKIRGGDYWEEAVIAFEQELASRGF